MIDIYKNKYLKYKAKYVKYKKILSKNKNNNKKYIGGSDNIIDYKAYLQLNIENNDLLSYHNNNIYELIISSSQLLENKNIFSKSIKNLNEVSDQKRTGRCWMFAILNILRVKFIKKYNLKPNFEFSENYLFFWDKLERVNYILHLLEENKNKSLQDIFLKSILKEPLGDGGDWHFFTNLIKKYGLVPKSIFTETHHSSSSEEINKIINIIITDSFKKIKENTFNKKEVLQSIYMLLVKCLGKPPFNFDWEYVDKDEKYHSIKNMDPNKFYKKININVDDYICFIDDPRNDYNLNISIEYFKNMVDGCTPKYLNTPIEKLKKYIANSIKNNESVYFGCDVEQFFYFEKNILDIDLFDYKNTLHISPNLTKKDKLLYYNSKPTHAMVFTGYNEKDKKINRWQVENSWGTNNNNAYKKLFMDIEENNNGYIIMSDKWFDNYVYMVVLHKKYVPHDLKKKYNTNIDKILPFDDAFGA